MHDPTQTGVHMYSVHAKLTQDSLESFFGKRGGYCDNPTVSGFLYGAQSLRVEKFVAVKSSRGNCKRGRDKEPIKIYNQPLYLNADVLIQMKQTYYWV